MKRAFSDWIINIVLSMIFIVTAYSLAHFLSERKYIGSEINPEYFKTAVKRIEQAAGGKQ